MVIVYETRKKGMVDSYKLAFVLKGMNDCFIPDAKNCFKAFIKKAEEGNQSGRYVVKLSAGYYNKIQQEGNSG